MSAPPSPDRVRRAAARLAFTPADPDALYLRLVEVLRVQGLPFAGACWHLSDPATGLFAWTGATGALPGDFVSALENEYLEDDVAKYAEIAARPAPLASLVADTGGRPERSARYRRMLAPDGFADELRIAFVDPFGRWGSLGLFSERPFGDADRAAAGAAVPAVARALRTGVAGAAAPGDDRRPGVLLPDGADRVLARDARADELLAGCAATGALPGAVHVLAARARAGGDAAGGRTMTAGGGWLALDASPVVDGGGAVTVVLHPAPPESVLGLRLRAAGLTPREREIATAVLRGDDTATIARALHLSAWTVQDHMKAIFAKTGVRSRRAFTAQWALRAAGVSGA